MSGLIENKSNYNETKIPILGDIPYIGKAFRKRQKRNYETELIIFLTPKVISFEEKKKTKLKTKARIKIKPEKTKIIVNKKSVPRGKFKKKIENRRDKIKNIFNHL